MRLHNITAMVGAGLGGSLGFLTGVLVVVGTNFEVSLGESLVAPMPRSWVGSMVYDWSGAVITGSTAAMTYLGSKLGFFAGEKIEEAWQKLRV